MFVIALFMQRFDAKGSEYYDVRSIGSAASILVIGPLAFSPTYECSDFNIHRLRQSIGLVY